MKRMDDVRGGDQRGAENILFDKNVGCVVYCKYGQTENDKIRRACK